MIIPLHINKVEQETKKNVTRLTSSGYVKTTTDYNKSYLYYLDVKDLKDLNKQLSDIEERFEYNVDFIIGVNDLELFLEFPR